MRRPARSGRTRPRPSSTGSAPSWRAAPAERPSGRPQPPEAGVGARAGPGAAAGSGRGGFGPGRGPGGPGVDLGDPRARLGRLGQGAAGLGGGERPLIARAGLAPALERMLGLGEVELHQRIVGERCGGRGEQPERLEAVAAAVQDPAVGVLELRHARAAQPAGDGVGALEALRVGAIAGDQAREVVGDHLRGVVAVVDRLVEGDGAVDVALALQEPRLDEAELVAVGQRLQALVEGRQRLRRPCPGRRAAPRAPGRRGRRRGCRRSPRGSWPRRRPRRPASACRPPRISRPGTSDGSLARRSSRCRSAAPMSPEVT